MTGVPRGYFTVHTGKRKRPMGSKQIESFEKRSIGSKAQRLAAAGLYDPPTQILRCDKCERVCHAGRCIDCDN